MESGKLVYGMGSLMKPKALRLDLTLTKDLDKNQDYGVF